MSSYRDDSNDTAVAGDGTWLGVKSLLQDAVRAGEALLFGLLVLHASSASADDAVVDFPMGMTTDSAQVSADVFDQVHALTIIADRATAADGVKSAQFVLHADGAVAADSTTGQTAALTVEALRISDEVIGQRNAATLVADWIRVADAAFLAARDEISEAAAAGDEVHARVRAADLLEDVALAWGEAIGSGAPSGLCDDSARVTAQAFDQLDAADRIEDSAQIGAAPIGETAGAQAWTAHADGWRMSRYAPFDFTSLAVIDGVAYASGPDGLHALSDGAEEITATLRTGRLDLSGGRLAHPVYAYMEYTLDGKAEMSVTQTQEGVASRYRYALPEKTATTLTSGRFTFGRGLRGRHFAFELTLSGRCAHINDLSVCLTPTNRRI